MRLNVVDLKGKKVGMVTVDDAVWGVGSNPKLVAQAVRVSKSNLRQGGSRTKNRSEVNRTGRKMWKQKGTGRARHGDRTAPQFVGGAKAHGPTGEENYKLRLNRKMRQGALAAALSDMVRSGKVTVIGSLPEIKKTKDLHRLLSVLVSGLDGIFSTRSARNPRSKTKALSGSSSMIPASPAGGSEIPSSAGRKLAIVVDKPSEDLIRAARNLEGVKVARPEDLNAPMLIENERLVITKEAIKKIK